MRFAQLLFTATTELNNSHEVLHNALSYTKRAEELGWDEVWTTEHQFNPHVVNPCALTLSSYLLGQTEHITIGTGVVLLPHTHPAKLAGQAALLQHLSAGRLRLGVGRGEQTLGLKLFSDTESWGTGFAPALAELKRLLATGEVQADVPLVPEPLPTSLVVAATSETSVKAAASSGIPFILGFFLPDKVKSHLLDSYRATAEAEKQSREGEHWISVLVHSSDSREQGLQELREGFIPWSLKSMEATPFIDPVPPMGLQAWEDIIQAQAVGNPEDIAARLSQLMQLYDTENLLIIAEASLDKQRTLENLECIMSEVKPLLS